jgi:hypothetical protein
MSLKEGLHVSAITQIKFLACSGDEISITFSPKHTLKRRADHAAVSCDKYPAGQTDHGLLLTHAKK